MTDIEERTETREALVLLTETQREVFAIAEQLNELLQHAQEGIPREALTALIQLPRPAKLTEIEAFARTLTTEPPWLTIPTQDRAFVAEVRCMIDDAVQEAKALNYPAATAHMRRAMNRLARIRDRDRADSKKLTKGQVEAFDDAAKYLAEQVIVFTDAARVEQEGGIA